MADLAYFKKRIAQAKDKIKNWASVAEHAAERKKHFQRVMEQNPRGSDKYERAKKKVGYWNGVLLKAKRLVAYWQVILSNRLRKKKKWLDEHPQTSPGVGTVTFDGKPVPKWIVEEVLKPARASGRWKGYVISGFRTPEYSESLCYGICGAPSCSGTCAGRNTNHSCPSSYKCEPGEGAVDVSDPAGLQNWCQDHGNPLIGNGQVLSRDIWHFSRSGR